MIMTFVNHSNYVYQSNSSGNEIDFLPFGLEVPIFFICCTNLRIKFARIRCLRSYVVLSYSFQKSVVFFATSDV